MKTIRYLKEKLKEAMSSEDMPLNERLDIYGEVDKELDEYGKIVMQHGLGYDDTLDDYEYVEKPSEYEQKYKDLEKAYRDRFFSDGGAPSEDEETEEEYEGLDELLESYGDEESEDDE